ncbi:MAG: phosphoribosylaminoimidazolesuccinocarboxamide synthase [Gemmatimonadetes bacterium]|nr:phosphoribosylaminoimidazolesuccinocarboxamide synthase [Gemmatimonadota bacterium]
MNAPRALTAPSLPLRRVHGGKVREVYEVDDERLLMVASDRVSAFDVVMAEGVPSKGRVLTQITAWWLDRLASRVEHHLISAHPDTLVAEVPALASVDPDAWAGRSMLVRRTRPVPIECVVRGYLAGSAWKEYRTAGTLAGEALPDGLQESARLDPPLFSPATKAVSGHDENITFAKTRERVGADLADRLRALSLEIYATGVRTAEERGILLADTKFEFGTDSSGRLRLIDEVLTPDSSRFWPAESWRPGTVPPSLDKQPVRDFLDGLDWDKQPPPPPLPDAVVERTTARYLEIFERLTGMPLDAYEPPRRQADA